MHLRFNFQKSLQAAGVLLKLGGGRTPYLKMLKLLYIADREMLAETAVPITGDRAFAMTNGPVLSQVYDFIKGKTPRSIEWFQYIETHGCDAELKHDPGRGKLSKAEVEKLTEVSERYRDKDQWELSDLTHDFPEWTKHFPLGGDGGSHPIPWEDVLKAQNRADMIEAVEEEEAARRHLDQVFGD